MIRLSDNLQNAQYCITKNLKVFSFDKNVSGYAEFDILRPQTRAERSRQNLFPPEIKIGTVQIPFEPFKLVLP